MIEENLNWLENSLNKFADENGKIRLKDFNNIVHSKNVRGQFV